MKKILYSFGSLVLFSSLLFISSCSKVVVVDGHVAKVTEVYTSAGSSTTTITTYTYDTYGRQIMSTPNSGLPTATVYTSYTSVSQTTGTSVLTYSLDAGLATHDNSGTTYAFDNNGYPVYERSGASYTLTNTIVNGNISQSVVNQIVDTVFYTYSYLSNTNYQNNGINFLGKPNKNLTSSEVVKVGVAGTPVTYSYAYTYDGQGRVTQMTVTGGGIIDAFTYVYTTN